MNRKTRVYVASPYSKGDVDQNVRHNIEVGDRLACLGYAPLIPLLNHFWHTQHPHDYQFWCDQDNEWIPLCDALLRVPSDIPSSGADAEEALAKRLGIPVVYSVEELLKQCPPTRQEMSPP